MEEVSGLVTRKEEFENCLADGDIQVERAIHKFELFHAAVEQPLQVLEQRRQWNLPDRNVERREAELARERTAARCLDINDAVRNVVMGVKVVRQGKTGLIRQPGRDDFG